MKPITVGFTSPRNLSFLVDLAVSVMYPKREICEWGMTLLRCGFSPLLGFLDPVGSVRSLTKKILRFCFTLV